jgi:hypothetical protein
MLQQSKSQDHSDGQVNPLLDAALRYASHGFGVFPLHIIEADGICSCRKAECRTPGKHPFGELVPHGVLNATTDPERIARWWKEPHNIGLSAERMLILDVDPRHGGDKNLAAILAGRVLAGAIIQQTGGGGQHYLYRFSGDPSPLRGDLAKGIQIKHEGGYIVVAPSKTQGNYSFVNWRTDHSPRLIEAPDWVITLCKKPASKSTSSSATADASKPSVEEFTSAVMAISSDVPRGIWIRTAMAIHDYDDGDAGLALFDKWSSRSREGKYRGFDDCKKEWRTFKKGGGINYKLVFLYANETGWRWQAGTPKPDRALLEEFYAYLPMHQYIYLPSQDLWPGASVDARVQPWPSGTDGKDMKPSAWLDRNRAVVQMTWQPGEPQIIEDKVIQIAGWVPYPGARIFNQYRPPLARQGDAALAAPWTSHLLKVYPDDADHIILWLAHRLQRPRDKIHHALVLAGAPGIGKDSLLYPVKIGVGPWNWQEINPAQMIGRFNGWVKAVVVRVSEARDLGEVNRFAYYEHSKVYLADPPDVLRVDEKNLREHYVPNVLGMIVTTNHASDGLYLPADDRRHYVAASTVTKDDFPDDYWRKFWQWYEGGGAGHVIAYLMQVDLSAFDAKAPPPKTPAFWHLVAAGEAPSDNELRQALEAMGNPDAFTMQHLVNGAGRFGLSGLAAELLDRKNRRVVPHMLSRVDYVPVRNIDARDGLWKIPGHAHRVVAYARRQLSYRDQVIAVQSLR